MTLSADDAEEQFREAFPHVERIEDDDLREKTIQAWVMALRDNDVDDIGDLPWFPPAQEEFNLGTVRGIDHIRDVTELAIAMTEQLAESRAVEPSLDMVIAGALLHDVSKIYEFDGMASTPIEDLLGHPYYGIVITFEVGLPIELAHIVLCHSPQTNVEPAILEARIVETADEVAADVLVAEDSTELRR
ncbi:MAG: HD domain-containing protein [Salinirussus sp.]